jgi:hypothetical protein
MWIFYGFYIVFSFFSFLVFRVFKGFYMDACILESIGSLRQSSQRG